MSNKSVYFLYLVSATACVHGSKTHGAAELQPDPLGAVNEAERDEGLSLVVGELVRPRHPAGEVGAGARALVLPVEHRAA
jgi:hypothetical protein